MSHLADPSSAPPAASAPSVVRVLVPLLVGSLVAVTLGAYGRAHDATYGSIPTLGFSSTLQMKSVLASIAVVLALLQMASALRMYGRIGSAPSGRSVSRIHRTSGVLAVLVTLPVAYQCLWGLGFQTTTTRVLAHSLLGCVFYGVFVAKMLTLRTKGVPGWALPWLGGLTFATLIGVWLTSALWYFTTGSTY
ncbi:MAG TPA: DUF6529 family protein [Candidatus Limnocylindria bacterium]|nr:DUF6529 family protein [Candidatus Limnocylindria bacterium]